MAIKKHRIFIAINLPVDIKKQLASYQQKWPEIPAKWTSPENLHITLEFLGDLNDQELSDVCKITKGVAEKHEPFSVALNQVCYGGVRPGSDPCLTPKTPRMVWAVGKKSKELSELKNDLQKSLLESVRFAPEERRFAPHITLARINEWQFKTINLEERPEVNENIDLIFTAESIEVMESILKRGGPQYTILESCELKN